jgi:hypothetical protein
MLSTDPITNDPATEHARVFMRRPPDETTDEDGFTRRYEAEAFHWGGLTTGHWLTALWILLGPFAFANVAGWMVTRRTRWAHAAIRLGGVALTCLFVAQLGYLFLEVIPALAPPDWRRSVVIASISAYVLVFVVGVVMFLSTQSHFHGFGWRQRLALTMSPLVRHLLPPKFWDRPEQAGDQWSDPAGDPITSPRLWDEHAIVHRIRRLHLAAGLGVIIAIVASGLDSQAWKRVALFAALLVAVLVIFTTTHPRAGWVRSLTAWLPLMLAAGLVGAITVLPASGIPPAPWPGIHETTLMVALALGATGLAALVGGWVSLGAIVMATLFGASLGTGLGLLGERQTGSSQLTQNGAGWVAVAMLLLVLTVLTVAVGLTFMGGPVRRADGVMGLLRRVTDRGTILFVVAAAYGIAVGALAFWVGCSGGCSPGSLSPPERGSLAYPITMAVFAVLVVLIAVRSWVLHRGVSVVVGIVGLGFVWLFASELLPTTRVAGWDVDFNDLVDLSKIVIIVLPVLLVLRSMLGSLRSGVGNRHVGILWDIASIWPRWFHPMAPPAYGPKVVESLCKHLSAHSPDLIEAHSQGSVIAAVTLSQMEGQVRSSLITYGSPIGILYSRFFPTAGVEALIAGVRERIRWINLWRDTDPIGGPMGLGDGDVPVLDGYGHSGYEMSKEFRDARHLLSPGGITGAEHQDP